jgi:hypothetical protein
MTRRKEKMRKLRKREGDTNNEESKAKDVPLHAMKALGWREV